MEKIMEQQLLTATEMIEQQVDAQLQQLDQLGEDDFDALRLRRLEGMKRAAQQRQEWLAAGHGNYEELADEAEFFSACKKSKNLVCHFYRESTFACKIIDKHMALLAPKHVEARFTRLNAERAKFLMERLRIKMMPTVCIARDGATIDYVVGLDDVGGREDFPTEMLEWRIARSGVIEYSGDLLTPPEVKGKGESKLGKGKKVKGKEKTIRGAANSDSDSDGYD